MANEIFNNHIVYDNYIELRVEGLTRGRELSDAYFLVLGSESRDAFYPIALSRDGYDMILAALKKRDFRCSRLMNSLASRVGMSMTGVRVMQPRNGETSAMIDFRIVSELVSVSAPVAEATVAALEAKSPIYVHRTLFEQQNRLPHSGNNMSIPVTAMGNGLLEQAMRSAVEEDNFELAILLRGELQRRGTEEGTHSEG